MRHSHILFGHDLTVRMGRMVPPILRLSISLQAIFSETNFRTIKMTIKLSI